MTARFLPKRYGGNFAKPPGEPDSHTSERTLKANQKTDRT
jgi:hypothetical protein